MKYWAIALSFGIALLTAAWNSISIQFTDYDATLIPGYKILGTLWVASVILAIVVHRTRGLWTLAGLPVACWWFIALVVACSNGHGCI
jgi:hypothetical protein